MHGGGPTGGTAGRGEARRDEEVDQEGLSLLQQFFDEEEGCGEEDKVPWARVTQIGRGEIARSNQHTNGGPAGDTCNVVRKLVD